MTTKNLKEFYKINEIGSALLKRAMDNLGLSARAYDRILKVARTNADIEV